MSPAVTRREEVLERIRSESERFRGLGVRRLGLFGSFARDEATKASDIDLLVEFEPGRSLLDHIALAQDLEDLLGREVDVVTEKGLHWYIRDRVCREAVPL